MSKACRRSTPEPRKRPRRAQRGQSPAQIRERYPNICMAPDPQTARKQYDTMLTQMVPDSSEAPGIKRRAVQSIAQLCHWRFPGK